MAGSSQIGDLIKDREDKTPFGTTNTAGYIIGPGTEYIFRSSSYQMDQRIILIEDKNAAAGGEGSKQNN